MKRLLTITLAAMIFSLNFITTISTTAKEIPEELIKQIMRSAREEGRLFSTAKLGDTKQSIASELTLERYNGLNYYKDGNDPNISYYFDSDDIVTAIKYTGVKTKSIKQLDVIKEMGDTKNSYLNHRKWFLVYNVYDENNPADQQYITPFYTEDGQLRHTMTTLHFVFPVDAPKANPSAECFIIANKD